MTVDNFLEDRQGVPADTVVVWSGALTGIPSGWAACDGNNGTPDLRGRFVRGTQSGEASGSRGGQSSWTPSTSEMASHTHSGSTTTDGGHNHVNGGLEKNATYEDGSGTSAGSDGGSSSTWTTSSGSHSHSVDSDLTGTSSPSTINNEPLYYELAYIMKL